MIDWNNENIDYFKDASEFTGFHRDLADAIKPYLKPEWTMGDMGCGLGMLDLQLAGSVSEVTSVDRNETVIRDLNYRIKEKNVKNITTEISDVNQMGGRKWDILLLSYFGGFDDEMDILFSLARHRVILVTFTMTTSELSKMRSELKKKSTLASKVEYLKSRKYDYKKITKTMEFGQPFRTMNDARRYFELYSGNDNPDIAKELIEKNMRKVVSTGDKTFPWFFPQKKEIGILIVDI